ncbi:MAG TPA: recombinase family protein [Candidatus Limnocylindria bacterium]|nr:recombinase family protein [Candidatus Limnocylindria bacterium]
MESSPKFFLYARKSTDEADRQVLSIEAQLFELREMAKREGVEIVREFIESRTAKTPGRPWFNEMMEELEAGKAQGIIAWHPDRLARNSMDGGKVIYLVDTGVIKDLKFPTFRFDPSAQGKFMLSIAFSQSKYYVDNLSENVKRGQRTKLRNGILPSRAPLGYRNDKVRHCIVVDEEKAPLVRKAFELYASGFYTLDEVRKRVNELGLTTTGGKPLAISNCHFLLNNPFYYGVFRYNGQAYEGIHQPIVSKRLFDEAQAVIERRSKPRPDRLKPYPFRGYFLCGECGCFVTTETQKGHNYMRCTKKKGPCSQRYVREELIADQLAGLVLEGSLPFDWPDKMLAELSAEQGKAEESQRQGANRIRLELEENARQLDGLLDMRLNRAISQAEYDQKKERLLNQKVELREKLTALQRKATEALEPVICFINEAKHGVFLAQEKNPIKCRDFLKKHGSNLTLRDKRVRVEFKNPCKYVSESRLAYAEASASEREIFQEGGWLADMDSNHD